MQAHPYDVDVLISNPNTGASSMETRRVYAYGAGDAMMQAAIEAAATAGSAEVKVIRVSPPPAVCPTIKDLLRA